jgi:phosphohistidine swiveling domain-containing protein
METELESLTNYTALRDADFRQVVSKYVIEPEIVQPFIDFGLVIDTRNEAEYVVSLCGYFLLPIYNEIAARLAISIEEVRTLFEEEIVACLDGKADAKTLIAEKAGYSANACFAGTQRLNLSGDVARAAMAYAESHSRVIGSDHSADGTKGVSASPGKARGVARIIPNPSENDRVGEGDILITFATTVDYLPAMKKAGAIVTEVGGLTCHAAVVSREFGIPCVVGLKDAMTTFKDGDMVEVDADKGVVRKV